MSGTFERLAYDPKTYATAIKQSTDPLNYRLDPSYCVICNPYRPTNPGYIGKIGVSLDGQKSLVDVESELLLLNYPGSRDPGQKYNPQCQNCRCNEGYPCSGGVTNCVNCNKSTMHFPNCDIGTEYTRHTNGLCTTKEIGINRFVPLYLNPQDESRWLIPSEVGISNRNLFKDNHVPCIPRPLDQMPLLPRGGALPCNKTYTVCNNFTAPLHNSYTNLNRNWNGLR